MAGYSRTTSINFSSIKLSILIRMVLQCIKVVNQLDWNTCTDLLAWKRGHATWQQNSRSWLVINITWPFSVADNRRQVFPLKFDASATVVIVVEVELDSTSTTVADQSPIELQQLQHAFPYSCNCCKTSSATIADWITAITTIWKPGFSTQPS